MTISDDLLSYRSESPILERTNYMISNSLGAMPRAVYDALPRLCRCVGHSRRPSLAKSAGGCWPSKSATRVRYP